MKTLLSNKTDFDNFVLIYTGIQPGHGRVVSYLDAPEKYPCVLVYTIEYDGNGPDYIDGDFVYLDDFKN